MKPAIAQVVSGARGVTGFGIVLSVIIATVSVDNLIAENPKPEHYPIHGKIEHIQAKYRILTIHHDAIPGFMEEMTMDFPVSKEINLSDLQVGDEIKGDLLVDGLKFQVETLEVLKK